MTNQEAQSAKGADVRVPSLEACLYLTCDCDEGCKRVAALGSIDPEQDARRANES